jgi:hypothetical protein
MGAAETAGEGGLEPKLRTSVIVGARRLSAGRVVVRGGDEGLNELAGVDGVPSPLDFATPETLAFTRTAGFGDELSAEERPGEDGVEGVG